jgi:magnesium-transporting ATPase (P-type)
MSFYALFFFSVALAVSTIPEGLPVAITVALTSASMAMSKKNVIVRKLAAIEGLGSCTLIASDKTGTLTQNRLSVEYFISQNQVYDTNTMNEAHDKVYLTSILCNEIHYEESKDGGIITGAKFYRKIDEIPYEPQNRFSAVMMEQDERTFQFSKGSPETVLEHCNITEEKKKDILVTVDEWALKGYRTIALAYKKSDDEEKIRSILTTLPILVL